MLIKKATHIVFVITALLLCAGLAQAQQAVTSPPQDGQRVGEYWTEARKASARPMPLRSAAGVPEHASPAVVQQAAGEPMTARAVLPAGGGRGVTLPADVADARMSVEPNFGPGSTVWYDYPPPGNLSVPVLDYFVSPQFPNTALGKLFFSSATSNFVCSAQSVTSSGPWGGGNGQTVVTAGHCCSDGAGTWFQNWLFEPAHLNGSAPFGSWTAHAATVYNAWHVGGDFSADYCVLQMNTLGGQNVNSAVGALGWAANFALPEAYYATGWPAAAPFTGGVLFYSTASDAETDTNQAGLLPFTHGIRNDMTGGSSGGAWILRYQSFAAGAKNLFNGLNSYKYTSPSRPAEMFGPYIDTLFVDLLEVRATAPPAP